MRLTRFSRVILGPLRERRFNLHARHGLPFRYSAGSYVVHHLGACNHFFVVFNFANAATGQRYGQNSAFVVLDIIGFACLNSAAVRFRCGALFYVGVRWLAALGAFQVHGVQYTMQPEIRISLRAHAFQLMVLEVTS